MNRDFAEMLSALSEAGAEFLIVGDMRWPPTARPGRRATSTSGFIRPPDNGARVLATLRRFGVALFDLTAEDLTWRTLLFRSASRPPASTF
jgi:hypothetical protein